MSMVITVTFKNDEIQVYNIFSDIFELENKLDIIKLYCYDNRLTVLPPQIGCLTNLQELNCCNNQLIELPVEIGQLVNLEWFDCYSNKLTKLPQLKNLINLQNFNCSNNQLTELPNDIGCLVNLIYLDCSNNELTNIPIEIVHCRRLRNVNYYGNDIFPDPILFCTNEYLRNCECSICKF